MMRKTLGIIGNPLGHSLSPLMHGAAVQAENWPYRYEKWELLPDELAGLTESVRGSGSEVLGFNVTIPYKEKILPFLDGLEETCRILGAVNTVKWEAGQLIGYNTDGLGLLESLNRHGVPYSGRSILLIGSGGAARGIAVTLALRGAGRIDFVAADLNQGMILKDQISTLGLPSEVYPYEGLKGMDVSPYDVIIQATPVGMKGVEGEIPFPYEALKLRQAVVDIVYNPLETVFRKECWKRGVETISGIEMLIYQGYHSMRIWTGLEEDTELMLEIGRRYLEGRE